MKIYDHILQGSDATLENAIERAKGMDWQSMETTEQDKPTNADYKASANGVDVYYDLACDTYLFVDDSETTFKFSEASEELQQTILEKQYDINVDHDWWDFTYEDAGNVGFKITGFDLGGGNSIDIELTGCPKQAIEDIMKNNGKDCDTYKIAESYLNEYKTEIVAPRNELQNEFDNLDELEELTEIEKERYEEIDCLLADIEGAKEEMIEKFVEDIGECYLSILKKEYEYLTSKEAIIESIESNDYDFDENGDIV